VTDLAIESIASDWHCALKVGHLVAAWFNWKRRNPWWVLFHLFVAFVDWKAERSHAA
jgi:hypothetical protein